MEQFKVGDKVYDVILKQWGQVEDVPKENYSVITVRFNRGANDEFDTLVHYHESDAAPRLYHEEMVIVPKRTQERVVQVREAEDCDWVERVLVKVLPSGEALCWIKATNLDEAKRTHLTDRWRYWRELPEKTKITRAEIAEKLGIDIDQLEITD